MLQDLVKQCTPLPPNAKLLVLGGGFSGQHVAALAKRLGSNVICSRRKKDKPGANVVFDSATKQTPAPTALKEITHLISCIPPEANGEDPVISLLSKQLHDMPLQWVGYLSTTGVYGDHKGNWVTEADLPRPQQLRSKRRLSCEQAWQASGLPVQILRLPGIYGPGRSALEAINKGKSKMIDKPGQVFSRIHVDDIAGAIFHLIKLASTGIKPKIINVADNQPSTNVEVLEYAASLLGSSLPPIQPFEIASKEMSPMALSFWEENRRVSNQMLCKKLGYPLLHPNYQVGLRDCLNQRNQSSSYSSFVDFE